MKRMRITLLGFGIIVSLCACQQIPEKAIVANKGGKLEKQIMEKGADEPIVDESAEKWQEELKSKGGEINIHINAPVNRPDKDQLPVVHVRPHVFSEEEVEVIVKELFGDAKLYDDDYRLRKDELEQSIISLRADLESLKNTGKFSDRNPDPGTRGQPAAEGRLEDEIERTEMWLKEYEEYYADAPDTIPEVTQIVFKETEGRKEITLCDDQSIPATIGAGESSLVPNDWTLEYRNWKEALYSGVSILGASDTIAKVKTPRDEAENIASTFIKKIGLDCSLTSTRRASDNASGSYAYVFIFSRNIEGIPCQNVDYNVKLSISADGAEYREPWYNERIEVMVNDDGIIGFKWYSPPEILETINDNVAIKTYDEIIDIARTMLPMQFVEEMLSEKQRDVAISEITLTMMRVARIDTDDEYYYLPVWDFIGYFGDKADPNISEDNPSMTKSFLTLNAIDGSVIDRGLGY